MWKKAFVGFIVLLAVALSAGSLWFFSNYAIVKGNIVIREFETDELFIMTSHDEIHKFDIEVARSEAEKRQGMMFRSHMPENFGMLFPFDPPKPVSFWMKNVYVPLDFIFLTSDGRIVAMTENNTPHDETAVNTGDFAVAGVLEVPAWTRRKLGINLGDIVIQDDFDLPPEEKERFDRLIQEKGLTTQPKDDLIEKFDLRAE